MNVDLAPLVQAFAALLLAAITAATPFIVPLLRQYLSIKLTAEEANTVQKAADVGAKAAYGFIVAAGAKYTDVPIRNVAIATGVQHVLVSTPDAIKALGIDEDHVTAMVSARLGGLLATDPTVTIGPDAPSLPAPDPVPPTTQKLEIIR